MGTLLLVIFGIVVEEAKIAFSTHPDPSLLHNGSEGPKLTSVLQHTLSAFVDVNEIALNSCSLHFIYGNASKV